MFQGETRRRGLPFLSQGQKLKIHTMIGQQPQLPVAGIFQGQGSFGTKNRFQKKRPIAHSRLQGIGQALSVPPGPENGRHR